MFNFNHLFNDMFEEMDREFHQLEQAMFANMGMGMAANAPVHRFQIVIEQQPETQIPAGMKKIPYEGPAENS